MCNNDGLLETQTIFGTFLHDAVSFGRYEVTKCFVDYGIDINKRGGVRDSSALTMAAFKGYVNIVELLHEKVDCAEKVIGQTVLSYA